MLIRRLRYLLVAAVASGVAFGVMAMPSESAQKRFLTIHPGDYVTFGGMDLSCNFTKTDPYGNDQGPFIYCSRDSVKHSRALGISKWRYRVGSAGGTYWVFTVNRAP